jgi:hypothetical protein
MARIRSPWLHLLPFLWVCYSIPAFWNPVQVGEPSLIDQVFTGAFFFICYPIFAVLIANFWFFFFHSNWITLCWAVLGGTVWTYGLSFAARILYRKVWKRIRPPRLHAASTV